MSGHDSFVSPQRGAADMSSRGQIRLDKLKPDPQKWREIMAQIILRDLCFDANLENHVGRINSYVKSLRLNA